MNGFLKSLQEIINLAAIDNGDGTYLLRAYALALGYISYLSPSKNSYSNAAASFSSANKEYLTVASNSTLQSGDTDLELGGWVTLATLTTGQIFFKGSVGEYQLLYSSASSNFRFGLGNGSANYVTAEGTVTAGTKYFVRAWRDKTANTMNIQINNGTIVSAAAVVPTVNTSNLYIGSNSGTGNFLDGSLDSLYLTKRISTAAEATSLYNNGNGRTSVDLTAANGLADFNAGLTSWWDAGEESGDRRDSKGSNHLTSAAAPIIQPPIYGSELLSNTGIEIYTGTQDDGTTDAFSNFTVEASNGKVEASATCHSGSNAVKITTGTTNNASGAQLQKNNLSVTAGKSYAISFWTRGDGTNGSRYSIYDNTNAAYISGPLISTGITSTSFTLVTTQITAPSGCSSISIWLYGPGVTGGIAYFDDISVKEITTAGIKNGGFENGISTDWTSSATGSSTINDETVDVYSGSHALRMDIDSANSIASISMTGLTLGRKYKISFYAKASVAGKTLSVRLPDTTNYKDFTLTTDYALYEVVLTSGATYINLIRGSAASASIYIDNVTVQSLGPVSDAGVTSSASQDVNYAAQFNGTSQYLSAANSSSIQTGNIDFEAGVFVNLDAKPSTNITIFSKSDSNTNREWHIRYIGSSDRFAFNVNSTGSSVGTTLLADNLGSPTVGNWYFIRVWHDSVADTINIQVNNGAINSAAYSSGVYSGTARLYVGSEAGNLLLPGRIDIAYFRKAISTTAEATSLWNNGKGLKYLNLPNSIKNDATLTFYNLDEKSGTRYDSTSNGNNLTDNGSVTQGYGVNYNAGIVATILDQSTNLNHFYQATLAKRPGYDSLGINGHPALLFDGVDDNMVHSGDIIGTGDITITTVIKQRTTAAGMIITNGKFIFQVTSSITIYSDGSTAVQAASVLTAGTPAVISVTRTSAGITNIYVNGTQVGTANQSSGTPIAGGDTYIGDRSAGSRAFDGWIGDDVIYSNKIISTAERQSVEKFFANKYGITLS